MDSLAGGPLVFSGRIGRRLDGLNRAGASTAHLFRELERVTTEELVARRLDEYWGAVEASRVDVLSISVGAWGDGPFSFRGAVQDLSEWHRRFRGVSRFLHVTEPRDLCAARASGRTGILLGFQNSTQIGSDLYNVEVFHALGVRMVQLTYDRGSLAGSGCSEPNDEGLTAFGRQLIRVLNALGVIVDVSHCGPQTTRDAIRWSRAPVAVSHSACHALHSHRRNKDDSALRALGASGGYFGVCAVPAFLAPAFVTPTVATMMSHIEHAVRTAGETCVGVGSDWGVPGSPAFLTRRLNEESRVRTAGGDDDLDFYATTEGFEDWSTGMARLGDLLRRDLGEALAARVLGESFLRFYERVESS